MKRLFSSLPVWIILIDLIYGFVLNILQNFYPNQNNIFEEGLTVSPDIAFTGLQAITNAGMILIIGFGLYTLIQLNKSILQKNILPIGIFRTLGLIAVLAFSIPSLWQWFWAILHFIGGTHTITFGSARYLIVALCQSLTAILCLWRLFGWYRLSTIKSSSHQ
ncbi:hypothetical protein [Neisseria montereyensis]|uniref:Integral membrane protein n=1 Tax=Neisseria montereyensis TaxID=2973938 RepID=A0ABT2FCP9_9NEIS|nr:hypothetical protein [Neisseria montereyensis]MCS4533983.1 hypothetical protein [Neisseria montereyensis]